MVVFACVLQVIVTHLVQCRQENVPALFAEVADAFLFDNPQYFLKV